MDEGNNFRQGLGFAMRLGTELLVATCMGALMGYVLDYYLNTSPWFMALGVIFGGAAGCLNVYRAAMEDLKEDQEEDNNPSGKEE